MTDPTVARVLGEHLVDAREAAHCLNLPLYLLTHPKERRRLGVPHYRVGKLVRFKLQELEDWLEAQGGNHG
jgi:excisionase family DNA binding protein